MRVFKRLLGPVLCGFFVSGLGTLDGCGTQTCLRNSDCGAHMECKKGQCIDPSQPPDASTSNGEGGFGGDGATSP
jgi:hypothetical protein